MNETFTIRWAVDEDWTPAVKMVWKTFMKYEAPDYTQEGIKNFFAFLTDGDLYRLYKAGKYQLMVALDGDRIIGVGSLRNTNFLSLLFVDEEYQMKGVGRAVLNSLSDYLKNEMGQKKITVRSSPYAVGFYRKNGFMQVGEEMHYSGITVTPMEKEL